MANSGHVGTPRRLALALAVSLTTVAVNAEPVDVIYSAENALYGAGYDIGIADGWMDSQLRSAIRQYQSSRNDLQTTGNLDINTLFSLGIATENGAPVTGNQVASREAALDALGLSQRGLPAGGSSSPVASAPAPEPAPEPIPEPEPEPEPETVAEPAQPEPATTESLATSEPKPEQTGSENTANQSAEPPALAESTTGDEPEMVEPEPEASPEPTLADASEPASESQPSATAETIPEQPDQSTRQDGDDQPEEEPVQTAAQDESTEESDQDNSSGGFFSWLYDFFFGWMF